MCSFNVRRHIGLFLIVLLVISLPIFTCSEKVLAQDHIKASNAGKYVGKQATVCGTVVSTKYAARSRGAPTFLNLEHPYPNQVFTVVIWGKTRAKFSTPPEQTYRGKKICVTGTITTYMNTPQIVVNDPSQISMGE